MSPVTYGLTNTGHCAHCGANAGCHATSAWGVFCLACCRHLTWTGPQLQWGTGMGAALPTGWQ